MIDLYKSFILILRDDSTKITKTDYGGCHLFNDKSNAHGPYIAALSSEMKLGEKYLSID